MGYKAVGPTFRSGPDEGRQKSVVSKAKQLSEILYPEGVGVQSPGSRSAPWVTVTRSDRYPERVESAEYSQADGTLSGFARVLPCFPRVRCATLGSVMQSFQD